MWSRLEISLAFPGRRSAAALEEEGDTGLRLLDAYVHPRLSPALTVRGALGLVRGLSVDTR